MARHDPSVRTEFSSLPRGTCDACGGSFTASRGKRRKFCSAACRRRYARLTRIAEWESLRSRLDSLIRRG